MKRTEQELDAELARMAEEVPPMPADFHKRWMSAVRAEAENRPAAETVPGKDPVTLMKWTRILSVAAAFIFLIGGTMLYRNSKKTLDAAVRTEKKAVTTAAEEAVDAAMPEEAPAAGMETAEEAAPAAMMEAAEYAEYEEDAEYAEAEEAPALMMSAAKGKETAHEAAPEAVSGNAAVFAAEEADGAYEAAEEEADAAVYKAEDSFADTGAAGTIQAAAAGPAPEATASPTEPVPETEEAAEEQKAGFLQEAGSFLADMGDFLLAALPYLAVLAVPAVAALVIRRKKNRKN